MNIVTALDDPRIINSITMRGTDERDGDYYTTKTGVEIHAYGENGMYCALPWFAIVRNNEIVTRLNGASVESITYVPSE